MAWSKHRQRLVSIGNSGPFPCICPTNNAALHLQKLYGVSGLWEVEIVINGSISFYNWCCKFSINVSLEEF